MKQSEMNQEMNPQRRTCAFQECHRYEHEQNVKRVLRSLRKNKYIVIMKPDIGNGVVILNRKLYNNAIEEIISGTSKFEKRNEDPTLKKNLF